MFHFRLKEHLLSPEGLETIKQIASTLVASRERRDMRFDGGNFLIKLEDTDRFVQGIIKVIEAGMVIKE